MHPLLQPRLYAQTETPPLPPLRRARPHRPVRGWLGRTALGAYLRFGAPTGFVLGLALAWWLFAPDAPR